MKKLRHLHYATWNSDLACQDRKWVATSASRDENGQMPV